MNIINKKDLEWLAWNYRSFKNEKMFKTRDDMIFGHYNRNYSFLPSPEQILKGIIQAQIDQFADENVEDYAPLIKSSVDVWKKIFKMANQADMRKPLTPEILSNPNNQIVKTLVYIYSMESFVFSAMNKASRQKDISKIELYGPLASVLGFIIYCGNKKQTSFEDKFMVYRGLKVPQEELLEKYKVGNYIHLSGFTSSTLARQTALEFAIGDPS